MVSVCKIHMCLEFPCVVAVEFSGGDSLCGYVNGNVLWLPGQRKWKYYLACVTV